MNGGAGAKESLLEVIIEMEDEANKDPNCINFSLSIEKMVLLNKKSVIISGSGSNGRTI